MTEPQAQKQSLSLDPTTIQNVLLEQLRESNENRYYLMAVIRQLETNHRTELESLRSELQDLITQQKVEAHNPLADMAPEDVAPPLVVTKIADIVPARSKDFKREILDCGCLREKGCDCW